MKPRITFMILAFGLHAQCASAQSSPQSLLDSVLARAERISLYGASVDWDSLRNDAHVLAARAVTTADLRPAFEAMLNRLRDHHGAVLSAKDYNAIARFSAYEHARLSDQRVRDPAIWRIVNGDSVAFEGRLIGPRIGYLKLVGVHPAKDIKAEAVRIRSALNALSKAGVERWVVDLRFNGGGNMHPMLEGLGPLIGDGPAGGLRDAEGAVQFDWLFRKGSFIFGNYQALRLQRKDRIKGTPRVAVLMCRWTVSSAEVVAACFKGRPNTRFFGEPSGGFTTSNSWEVISDEVVLNISTGYYADRLGTIYRENMPVDVEVPFQVEPELDKDECVRAAVIWLNESQ